MVSTYAIGELTVKLLRCAGHGLEAGTLRIASEMIGLLALKKSDGETA